MGLYKGYLGDDLVWSEYKNQPWEEPNLNNYIGSKIWYFSNNQLQQGVLPCISHGSIHVLKSDGTIGLYPRSQIATTEENAILMKSALEFNPNRNFK